MARNTCGHGRNGWMRGNLRLCDRCKRIHDQADAAGSSRSPGPAVLARRTDAMPRPCPKHPTHMLRGGITRCAHPDC